MKNTFSSDKPISVTCADHAAREPGRLLKSIFNPMVCSIVAATGVFGGISALFAGLICVVIHEIIAGDVVYNQVGTTLLVMAIPMILVGSIFLDEIRGNNR